MSFQISALPAAHFKELAALSDSELGARNIQKKTVESHPDYPCRVSLEDAEIGETIYLLNFTHHDQATPYKASHAIFVREGVEQAHPMTDEIPRSLSSRLLSVRAYDAHHDMVDADVCDGRQLGTKISTFFADSAVVYLHLHNARPGCYAARVDRI
ncbi:MAG: DUF1203 domain-containing protein [Hyphomonadaceae bacterium]|nr:DUF1203 domain-containing protein [Hyphomonadaceae bacterium]